MSCPWRNGDPVGAAGFEPTTSASRSLRATKLRYAPFLSVVKYNAHGAF